MNNKGFTMIELLAVVTILSIILLVSFPALLNMTRSDKEREYKDLANTLCKAGETYIYNNKELYPELGTSGKEFYIRVASLIDEELVNKSQTNPKNGKSIDQNLLKYKVKGDKTLSCSYLERSLATLVNDTGESGLSIGDKYSYEVRSGTKYNFYVLSFNSDNTVNLIMDRNICEDGTTNYTEENNYCRVAWYDDGDNPANYDNDTNEFGPVTAMQGLYDATKNWSNVPDMNLDYSDEGHIADNSYGYWKVETTTSGIKITKKDDVEVTGPNNQTPVIVYEEGKSLKARLPKLEEVYNTGTDANHCHDNNGTCPAWLTNGLESYTGYYQENDHILGLKGYWLLSSSPGSADVRIVYYLGNGNTKSITSNVITLGLRPVITVPISDFED